MHTRLLSKLLAMLVATLGLAMGTNAQAAMATGDIAFTAFNADEDGWSLVTFVDIAPHTTIFFSDGTATSATAIGATESSFSWDTGVSAIAAGTVIRFSAIDAATRAASIGTFSVVNSTNLGLSATAETVYAFLGTSSTSGSTVTTMLSAASSEANNSSLTAVGLTAGANAIKLTSSADFGEYTGARSGLTSFAAYAGLINDAANWNINVDGNGTGVVPNTAPFAVSAVPLPAAFPLLISGLLGMLAVGRRRTA